MVKVYFPFCSVTASLAPLVSVTVRASSLYPASGVAVRVMVSPFFALLGEAVTEPCSLADTLTEWFVLPELPLPPEVLSAWERVTVSTWVPSQL